MKITHERFSVIFISFWSFWPSFSFSAVWLYLMFVSKFHWLEAFLDRIGLNKKFLIERKVFCCLVTKTLSKIFSVCFSSFWPIFSFGFVLAVFVFKQQVLIDLKRFEKNLVMKTIFCHKFNFWYFVTKIIPKHFSVVFSVFQRFGSIFSFCVFWPFRAFHSVFLLKWSVLDELNEKYYFCWTVFLLTGHDDHFKRLFAKF